VFGILLSPVLTPAMAVLVSVIADAIRLRNAKL
jgi:hypothetical protein